MVELLLSRGGGTESICENNLTPLLYAVSTFHRWEIKRDPYIMVKIVEILLNYNADFMKKNDNGETAFMIVEKSIAEIDESYGHLDEHERDDDLSFDFALYARGRLKEIRELLFNARAP